MNLNINDLVKPSTRFYHIITHQVTQKSFNIDHYFRSTFIEKHNILVKGEFSVSENSLFNKNKLVFFDLKSGKVRGEHRIVYFLLIRRFFRDFDFRKGILFRPLRVGKSGLYTDLVYRRRRVVQVARRRGVETGK